MEIKGNLRRFFVFLFELWLAATLVLVLLCVLANTGGSPEMPAAAEVCNCSQIGIASSRISEEVTGTSGNSNEVIMLLYSISICMVMFFFFFFVLFNFVLCCMVLYFCVSS